MALSIAPSAVWELDDTTGTSLVDATGNGFTLTTHNSPTLSASGKVGTAVSWAKASSQYADMAHSATFNSASYSVTAWINKASTGSHQVILAHDGTASSQGWTFYVNLSDNKIHLVHQNVADVTAGSALSTSTWYHVGAVYNGSTATFYVNGSSVGSPSLSAFNAASSTITLACNKTTAAAPQLYWDGTLDQVCYFPGALTSGDMSTLYNGGAGLAYPFSASSFMPPLQRRNLVPLRRSYNW